MVESANKVYTPTDLAIATEGKLASASTISSPWPMRASTFSSCGERMRGIPRKTTMFSVRELH